MRWGWEGPAGKGVAGLGDWAWLVAWGGLGGGEACRGWVGLAGKGVVERGKADCAGPAIGGGTIAEGGVGRVEGGAAPRRVGE